MNHDAIGVFDSGLGGLTAVKALMKYFRMKILYFLVILPESLTEREAVRRF